MMMVMMSVLQTHTHRRRRVPHGHTRRRSPQGAAHPVVVLKADLRLG